MSNKISSGDKDNKGVLQFGSKNSVWPTHTTGGKLSNETMQDAALELINDRKGGETVFGLELDQIGQGDGSGLIEEGMKRAESMENISTTLHQAARDGDTEVMKYLLVNINVHVKNKRINKLDKDKMSPLHYATRFNYFPIVKLLVEEGAEVNLQGEDGATPLHYASRFKKSSQSKMESVAEDSIIFYLVGQGAQVNCADIYGQVPLHFAAMRGNEIAAWELIQYKDTDLEACDKQNMTPMHFASTYGNTEIVKLLLNKQTSLLWSYDEDNAIPFHHACQNGNLDIVKMLLDATDNHEEMLKKTENYGNSGLHLAVESGHLEIVKLCLDKGAFVNRRKKNKSTPLHAAAENGSLEMVKLLIDHNSFINAQDAYMSTALHRACYYNYVDIVEFLLTKGAKLEKRDRDNFTPLLIAASNGHTETVQCLLEHGADMFKMDKDDKTALFWAAQEDSLPTLKAILNTPHSKALLGMSDKYGNEPMHVAAEMGHLAIIKELLDCGARLETKNEEESTPMHLAAKNGRTNTVRALVGRNKSILKDEDEKSNTPLHLAAIEGHIKLVAVLLEAGANVEEKNCFLWTPLDCAASEGHSKTVKLLLNADAPVDPIDKAKTTPLHLASKGGHEEVVRILLDYQADVSLTDAQGLNALSLAVLNHKKDVALAIVNHDSWKEALSSSFVDPDTNLMETPIRLLIRKMPDIAVAVFNRCTYENEMPINHPDYKINFDYELLDDMYCNWTRSDNDNDEGSSDTASLSFESAFEDDGRLKSTATAYTYDTSTLKKNHPLMIMVTSKREELLGHPLVTSLLRHKWNRFGRIVYYLSLVIYLVFLALLTTFVLISPPPFYTDNNATTGEIIWYSNGESRWSYWLGSTSMLYIEWIIVALSIFSLIKELFQMYTQGKLYFNFGNLMEWAVYVLTLIFVLDLNQFQINTSLRQPWQWQCGAIAIFLAWMNLIIFIRKFPLIGIYVVMFTDILKTFGKFFVIFFLFIVAFSFGFYALLMNQDPFQSPQLAMIKIFVMMIGEFDYASIFFAEPSSCPDYSDQDCFENTVFYRSITFLLFVTFLVVMTIIIMNLLVGLAVDDIKGVQDQAVLQRYAMQVELVLDVEYHLPNFVSRWFVQKKDVIYPNRGYNNFLKKLYALFVEGDQKTVKAIAKALRPDKNSMQVLQEQQEDLQNAVRGLKSRMKDMKQQSDRIESMLQAIIEKDGIEWDEKDEIDIY